MSGFPHTFRAALKQIAEGSHRAIDALTGWRRPLANVRMTSAPPPPHVESRLEEVFDALAELPQQPSVGGAFELASDALASELPTGAMAGALHDFDADEMRFVVVRGSAEPRLAGSAMSVAECLGGQPEDGVVVTHGGPDGAAWIAPEDASSPVLLCPIVHEQTLLGLLALAEPVCVAEFGRHDVQLVRYVSEQLGAFIHDFRLRSARSESTHGQ